MLDKYKLLNMSSSENKDIIIIIIIIIIVFMIGEYLNNRIIKRKTTNLWRDPFNLSQESRTRRPESLNCGPGPRLGRPDSISYNERVPATGDRFPRLQNILS